MSEVPTVNPDSQEIPDSEGADEQWVDPIFLGQNPEHMSDELEVPEGEEPAKEIDGPTAEQLKRVIANADEPTDVDPKEGEPAPAEEPEEGEAAPEEAAEAKEGDTEAEEQPETDGEGKKPRRRSRARRERRAQQRQFQELSAKVDGLAELIRTNANGAAEEAPAEPEAPKLEDFDYDTEKWSTALTDYTEKKIEAGQAQAEEKRAEGARQEEVQRQDAVWATFTERQDAAIERYEDYEELVMDNVDTVIPEAAVKIIVESETGPDLAYWLAKNQDEATRIAGLSDIEAAREIGRIEATLAAEAPAPEPKPDENSDAGAETAGEKAEEVQNAEEAAETTPQTAESAPRQPSTKAPAPMPVLSGGGGSISRSPGKMDMDEYIAARRSGKIK